jgi:hypothetical protein
VAADPGETLRGLLAPDEQLLWTGRPARGIRLRRADAAMIPFSVMWGGFAVFWEWGVIHDGRSPFFFRLWGVPFVLVGAYMVVGRFFWDAYQRSNTFYGVSTQRVIVATGGVSSSLKSLRLRTLAEVTLTPEFGGLGSIYFGPQVPLFVRRGTSVAEPPKLEMLDDARVVYEIIRRVQGAAT